MDVCIINNHLPHFSFMSLIYCYTTAGTFGGEKVKTENCRKVTIAISWRVCLLHSFKKNCSSQFVYDDSKVATQLVHKLCLAMLHGLKN